MTEVTKALENALDIMEMSRGWGLLIAPGADLGRAGSIQFAHSPNFSADPACGAVAAIPGDAIMLPKGTLALPGVYEVRLTVAGQTYPAALEVKMDPRVSVTGTELTAQVNLAQKVAEQLSLSHSGAEQILAILRQTNSLETKLTGDQKNQPVVDALKALDEKLKLLGGGGPPMFPAPTDPTMSSVNAALSELITTIGSADGAPTAQASEAYETYRRLLAKQLADWQLMKSKDLTDMNTMLRRAGLAEISLP